jgi:hypothetical protein
MCSLPTRNTTKLLNLHPYKTAVQRKISDTDHEARLNVGNLYRHGVHVLEFFCPAFLDDEISYFKGFSTARCRVSYTYLVKCVIFMSSVVS